ncbi:MAG: alpha/beta hydrolase [Pleurocapsa sp. MO_192.B19]|nr:alpha/beta hydrolase [Pleurocapsa sp. MO_192.B19]
MVVRNSNPQFLLFAQHGWADTGNDIGRLAKAAADSQTLITSPSLGLIKTFIRIEPLVQQVEQIATRVIKNHPYIPIKIMGHSMGGLIWLEVLNRNPQWWEKVHSFILLGSPVGGSNIARLIDPLGIGIGTARDLGKNRRDIAEKIAQQIPTLSIASDVNMGSDGLVTVENTKFAHANWLLISDIPHHMMKCHAEMIPLIQNFWANPNLGLPPKEDFASQFIQRLRSVPGMTDADYQNFGRSQVIMSFADGTTIHTCNNLLGINHIFVGKERQKCLYAGYVGLIHTFGLRKAIAEIREHTT